MEECNSVKVHGILNSFTGERTGVHDKLESISAHLSSVGQSVLAQADLSGLQHPAGWARTTVPDSQSSSSPSGLLERLLTYKPSTWFAKPAALSPTDCASRGWVNSRLNTLDCVSCRAKLVCLLPASLRGAMLDNAVTHYESMLFTAHKTGCFWRQPKAPQVALPLSVVRGLDTRSTASAASTHGGVILEGVKLEYLRRRDSFAKLDTTIDIRPEALHIIQKDWDLLPHSHSANDFVALDHRCILAACGWQLELLDAPAIPRAFFTPSSPYGVQHLVSKKYSSKPDASLVNAAQSALRCELCQAMFGLWNCIQTGPFFRHPRPAAAHIAVQASSSASAALSRTIAGGHLGTPLVLSRKTGESQAATPHGLTTLGLGKSVAFGQPWSHTKRPKPEPHALGSKVGSELDQQVLHDPVTRRGTASHLHKLVDPFALHRSWCPWVNNVFLMKAGTVARGWQVVLRSCADAPAADADDEEETLHSDLESKVNDALQRFCS